MLTAQIKSDRRKAFLLQIKSITWFDLWFANPKTTCILSGLATQLCRAIIVGRNYHYGDGVLLGPKWFVNRRIIYVQVSCGHAGIVRFVVLRRVYWCAMQRNMRTDCEIVSRKPHTFRKWCLKTVVRLNLQLDAVHKRLIRKIWSYRIKCRARRALSINVIIWVGCWEKFHGS